MPSIGGTPLSTTKFICLTTQTAPPSGGNSKPKGILSITGFIMAFPILIILVFSML